MPTAHAPTHVRTTVDARVIRRDGTVEDLGTVADSTRQLTRHERLRARLRRLLAGGRV